MSAENAGKLQKGSVGEARDTLRTQSGVALAVCSTTPLRRHQHHHIIGILPSGGCALRSTGPGSFSSGTCHSSTTSQKPQVCGCAVHMMADRRGVFLCSTPISCVTHACHCEAVTVLTVGLTGLRCLRDYQSTALECP